MLRNTALIIGLLCIAFLVACGKTETTNSTASNGNSTNPASTSGTASTASSAEKIGVAECDDFIAKYDACVSGKVPEAQRAMYKNAIDQWRKGWKQLADNPATKPTLAAQCKKIADQQNTALKAYGCTF